MSSLKASKTYKRGDIIMTNKPLVYSVVDDMKSQICDYCLKSNTALLECSYCQKMFYCNENCQINDWPSHQLECHILANNQSLMSSTIIVIRLWLMILRDETILTKEYCLPSGQKMTLNDMKMNISEDMSLLTDNPNVANDLNSISIKDIAVIQFRALIAKLEECKLEVDPKLIWSLFVRLWSNVLRIDVIESDNDYNAYGLFVSASALSHSCEPNACYVSYGNHLQVRAIKTIQPNQQITISYIDFAKPKSSRSHLLMSYFFDCKCIKCQLNTDSKIDYKSFMSLKTRFNHMIKNVNDSSCQELLEIADCLVPYYESIYVDSYPDLSLFLFNYLKVMLINNMRNKSKNINQDFLTFVINNVKISHGIDHKLFRKTPIINDITLLDLESNPQIYVDYCKLNQKRNSKVKTYLINVLFIFIILYIIYDNFF